MTKQEHKHRLDIDPKVMKAMYRAGKKLAREIGSQKCNHAWYLAIASTIGSGKTVIARCDACPAILNEVQVSRILNRKHPKYLKVGTVETVGDDDALDRHLELYRKSK